MKAVFFDIHNMDNRVEVLWLGTTHLYLHLPSLKEALQ